MPSDRRFHGWVPIVPPTENHVRTVGRSKGGGPMIIYTREARSFQASFRQAMQGSYWKAIQAFAIGHRPESAYAITLRVFLPTLVNKSWLDTKNKASSLYKKVDAPNRDKLVLDTFCELIGIDDAHAMRVTMEKHMDPDFTGVEIIVEELDPLEHGVPPEYLPRVGLVSP